MEGSEINLLEKMDAMKKTVILISIIFSLFMAVSCNMLRQEKLPGIDMPLTEMNNELHLSAPPEINTFTFDDNLSVAMINSSDKPIILPKDFGVHLFRSVDGKWEAVENRIEYPFGEQRVYPRNGHPENVRLVTVAPFVLTEQPVVIRVVVIGNYYDEVSRENGEQVGAYIDVTLNP